MTVFVFVYVFTIRAIYKVLSKLSGKICNQYCQWSPEEQALIEEQKCLIVDQQQINPQDEFPKYARLQRKIDGIKEKIKNYESTRKESMGRYKMLSKIGVLVFVIGIHLSFLVTFRKEPVIVLPQHWFFPFQKVLSFPTAIPGALGLPCWMVTCNKLIERFII
ncbi:Tail-anchored protein insertion receptor WRB [Exaiptasia diaphana]|nr:Tail-anchored protein insertion receptor WRB [Exaiptasia diaphana]